MPIRPHLSQHEKADDLPLITESAVVTDMTVMDENRKDEVVSALEDIVDGELPRNEGEPDWKTVEEKVSDGGDKDKKKLAKLRERYERPYPSLMSIRFKAEDEYDFAAGQSVTVRFHDTPRPYSLASSPNDCEDEICIKRVPGGQLTSELFENMSEGAVITVRGPNGDFILQEPSERDMVFLATGTGVAPLRSMIRYTFQEERDFYEDDNGDEKRRNVWLFLGASWKDDLPYRQEFEKLDEERENFHFVPTLSRENYLTDWEGETDYVQDTLVKYLDDPENEPNGEPAYDIDARLNPENMEVYACGVSAMVESVVDAVQDASVPEECIEAEGFG
ncbi:MAG: FAD-dependent oxidoreductase [Halobacteria archaeon]|nr:FAD-dependent oxidoreductase [Halobacteria archaeon]